MKLAGDQGLLGRPKEGSGLVQGECRGTKNRSIEMSQLGAISELLEVRQKCQVMALPRQ